MGLFQSKVIKKDRFRGIIDRIFNYFSGQSGNDYITFQELFTAVLLVYNDINKYFPGPHYDPPKREEVQDMLKTFDTNRDNVLDREEFAAFIEVFTSKLGKKLGRNLLIYTIGAPALALITKRATENVPHVGGIVRRVPNVVYTSLVIAAVVLIEKMNDRKEGL